MVIQRNIYMVVVKRGKHTRYFYGERLKDALSVSGSVRLGERFTYARFVRCEIVGAKMERPGVYVT